jgi:HSF-type DNA-binding
MDSSRNTLTMDDSSNKIGGSPVPGGVPNGGEGPPDQMIEPLPAYGIQYFPYQQQAQQQQLGNNNAERRVPQNEPLEDPDTYQPLPINPPLVRNQQKIQPQQVFAFEEESQQEEDNGRASPFYFPDGPQLARKSLHQNMEEENFETPSRRDFLYTEEEERQNGQIYQQTQGGTTHSPESNMGVPTPPEQRTQETMIEPVLLHGQRPAHQQTEQQQQFQEEIDPQPWPPKPSPLPIPQPESQTWWNSNSAAETNDLRHEDGSFQPAASLPPSRGQQITEAREQGEQLELLQQRLPQVMLGKQFQTQQAGDNILQGASLNRPMYAPTILTEGTTPGIIWPGVTMQLHQISRPFENQLIFQQSHSQFTTGNGGLDFLGGIAESARLQATNRQLHPEQVQQHKANLSSATTAPQVTVDMVRKSRKNKQSETTVDNYVLRVHDMLEEAESQKFADIVSWQNHGRAFKIHSPEKFYEEILPKYFHCKQSSFVRWLRAWGFVRLIEGPDRGAYFHRYFVRGTTSLIKNKTRSQMHEAMDNWPRVGNITTSLEQGFRKSAPEGTKTRDAGNDANAAKYDKQNAGEDVVKPSKDPKVLRGKLLHEVRDMLRMAEIEGFSDIVSWCKSGQSFRIHKRGLFQKEIISKYLSCSKMTYLSDMLRMWGFCRLKQASGDEKNAYYHRLFQKGKPELCRNLSKEEMYEYMKDFREEQKRLQETSWSLIVADVDIGEESQRGGEDQRRNNTAADAGGSMDQSSTGKKHAVDTTCHGASSTSVRHQAPAASPSPHTMQNDPMPNEVQGLDTATGSIFGTVGNTAATANLNSEAYLSKTWIATSYTTNTYVNGIRNMLEDAEPKGFTDIVSWRPHGRCFKVHDEKHFEEAVCECKREYWPAIFCETVLDLNSIVCFSAEVFQCKITILLSLASGVGFYTSFGRKRPRVLVPSLFCQRGD